MYLKMEAKFKSLSIFEFQARFSNEEVCFEYLAELKWSKGFTCKKCKHKRYCNGLKPFDRQCTKCNYLESPTSGTIFHKVKFSILKAFWIVYYLATSKKGMSSTELSRKLQLRQKTCWLFRMKVLQAMASNFEMPLEGKVEVDECVIGQIGNRNNRKNKKSKDLVIIAIEKKGKGISRICAQKIGKPDKQSIRPFIIEKIDEQASIKTNAKPTYVAISKEFNNLCPGKSPSKSAEFKLTQRVIMSLKAWLQGTHGHTRHLQFYLNEYCYRFNRHLMKLGLFENLILRMVQHAPAPYKLIISYAPNSQSEIQQ